MTKYLVGGICSYNFLDSLLWVAKPERLLDISLEKSTFYERKRRKSQDFVNYLLEMVFVLEPKSRH